MIQSLIERRKWFQKNMRNFEPKEFQPKEEFDEFYTCPCCGYNTLRERGGYEICLLCTWEDDGQDDADADKVWGGPNADYSLTEARKNFEKYHTMYRPDDTRAFGLSVDKKEVELKNRIINKYDELMTSTNVKTQKEINKGILELMHALIDLKYAMSV